MKWSIQVSEQRLLRASVDLSDQLAEVQRLRTAIQLAEASRRYLTDPKVLNSIDGPSGFPAFDC